MAEPSEIDKSGNTYIIDGENAAELARSMNQDQIITKCMGGFFPPGLDTSRIRSTLDIASGAGGWAIELAYAHPEIHVVGIDISPVVTNYANTQAQIQCLRNVHFTTMDVTRPLYFADHCFDFVNARFLIGFLFRDSWPFVIQELVRVTRPGGIIRLTETDGVPVTNSPAQEKLDEFYLQACHYTGRSFHPYGRSLGVTPLLQRFLLDAGCKNVHEQAFTVNISNYAKNYSNYDSIKIALKLREPFLIQAGVATQSVLDELYEQMLAETLADDFCGIWYYLSAWGQKPGVRLRG